VNAPSVKPPIAFLAAYTSPTLGMERSAIRLVEALRHDYDITVVNLVGPTLPIQGVRTLALSQPGKFSTVRKWLALARWSLRSPRHVVVVGAWVAVPWLLIQRGKEVRTLVWEHSLSESKVATSRSLRILAAGAKRLYSRAARVVVVSTPLRDDVEALIPGLKATVIPNIIETRPDLAAKARPGVVRLRRLLTIGSLTPTKRQHVAIEALTYLPEDVTLDIAGDGPEGERLKARAKELGLSSRVTFHGHLNQQAVRELLDEADVLVHPSAGETFGLVFFEAAEAGLPVIASDNALSRSMIPHYVPGCTFEGDGAALANELVSGHHLMDDASFARAARHRQEEFSSTAIVESWKAVLGELRIGPPPT
jgi:glycosyltransferase involved in cell wall biosynthesis